jgi:hypothetical protein
MRFRFALSIALAVATTPALADIEIPPVAYPRLPSHGAGAEAFVPAGWRLEFTRTGDLNKDGRPDIVFVLRMNDPRNVVRHDAMGQNPLDTNPRILAAAFAQEKGGYHIALQDHELIPRHDIPTMDDPLDPNGVQPGGVEVKNGTIRVTLGRFMSAGGWGMGKSTFTFRWKEGDCFQMIGYDNLEVRRNTGEIEERSVNFSTRRVKLTKSSMETEGPGKVTWYNLVAGGPTCIEYVGNGLEYEIPAP